MDDTDIFNVIYKIAKVLGTEGGCVESEKCPVLWFDTDKYVERFRNVSAKDNGGESCGFDGARTCVECWKRFLMALYEDEIDEAVYDANDGINDDVDIDGETNVGIAFIGYCVKCTSYSYFEFIADEHVKCTRCGSEYFIDLLPAHEHYNDGGI